MNALGKAGQTLACTVALASLLAGCVAQIQESRLEGPARPTPDAHSEVVLERRTADDGAVECRSVTTTAPMVRDVVLRRNFADGGQERNGAIAMLFGAGVGALVFSAGQVQCSQGGACQAPTIAAAVVTGVALIPLGFLAYNAARVQDRQAVEPVPPETRPGPWHPCSSADGPTGSSTAVPAAPAPSSTAR